MAKKDNDNAKYVKIWGEHIDLRKFLIGLLISTSLLVITLIVTPEDNDNASRLIFGLIAVCFGFGINIRFIKPKRNIYISKGQEDDN